MKFTDSIRNIIKRLFGVDPAVTEDMSSVLDEQTRRYRELRGTNLTAIFAGKLAALTVTESTVEVIGDNQRAEALNQAIQSIWEKARRWVSTAFGTGGVLLIPYVRGGKIYTDIVPQSSMVINRVNGDELLAVSILADTTVQGNEQYFRWTDYSLGDDGVLSIRQRATDAVGAPVPLSNFTEWAQLPEKFTIRGVEHLPLAYIKCPVDSRRSKTLYGVPITYGCDDRMREIEECLDDIRREYNLKKPIVFMDQMAFKNDSGKWRRPLTGLIMTATPGSLQDAGKFSEVYDPAIRDSAYYNRLQHLYELLEKQVGTSRGILTEPTTRGATATEIKAGLYDTYAIVELMRTAIGQGLDRLAYAIDVLSNCYRLTPMGDYELSFDWSYAMIESSQESFNQLVTAAQTGAVEPAEIRQYVFPDETLEEAQARCDEIAEKKKDSSRLLMEEALAEEAQLG